MTPATTPPAHAPSARTPSPNAARTRTTCGARSPRLRGGFWGALLLSGLVLAPPATAQEQEDVPPFSVAELKTLVEALPGTDVTETDEDTVSFTKEGVKSALTVYDNGLQLWTVWRGSPVPSMINKWNAEKRFTKAYLRDGRVFFESDLVTVGTTEATVTKWLKIYTFSISQFREALQEAPETDGDDVADAPVDAAPAMSASAAALAGIAAADAKHEALSRTDVAAYYDAMRTSYGEIAADGVDPAVVKLIGRYRDAFAEYAATQRAWDAEREPLEKSYEDAKRNAAAGGGVGKLFGKAVEDGMFEGLLKALDDKYEAKLKTIKDRIDALVAEEKTLRTRLE